MTPRARAVRAIVRAAFYIAATYAFLTIIQSAIWLAWIGMP